MNYDLKTQLQKQKEIEEIRDILMDAKEYAIQCEDLAPENVIPNQKPSVSHPCRL